ncbi:hypothetical protein [Xanthomonas fragariae]|uniref:hypothetical protein n=1 Tax=Xanthomonas fragariae TaxID=48664 RepID=UPI001431DA83|nr:hypothetical protein [Xanthomonas fragariae]MDM7554389.1 hypothetical protein [Xanthomonas fragariae]
MQIQRCHWVALQCLVEQVRQGSDMPGIGDTGAIIHEALAPEQGRDCLAPLLRRAARHVCLRQQALANAGVGGCKFQQQRAHCVCRHVGQPLLYFREGLLRPGTALAPGARIFRCNRLAAGPGKSDSDLVLAEVPTAAYRAVALALQKSAVPLQGDAVVLATSDIGRYAAFGGLNKHCPALLEISQTTRIAA